MRADITEDELSEIYYELERVIRAVMTDSNMKALKHQYFMSESEMAMLEKAYYIVVAEIRQGMEKWYNKQIDGFWKKMVAEETERPKKRGGRPRKTNIPVSKAANEQKVGGLVFKS